MGEVRLEVDGTLARITLSNPRMRNALTTAMYDQLEAAALRLADEPSVRLVVIQGDSGTFAAGTDIKDLVAVADGPAGVAYEARITEVLDAVRALRMPVMAVVEGHAVGGGLALLLCCDLVYCTPDAIFGSPVARTIGNCISPATIARLRHTVGRQLANELLLLGRMVRADAAAQAGLVRAVIEPEEIDATVNSVLSAVLDCAPLSLAAFKEVNERLDAARARVDADDVYETVYGCADFHGGVESFLAKRPPRWTGR